MISSSSFSESDPAGTRIPLLASPAVPTGNLLVVYCLRQWPLRATIRDHLMAFERHSQRRCFYLNLAVRGVPRHLRETDFDLIVFHTTFLAQFRWAANGAPWLLRRARPLAELDAVRAVLPQDEFLRSDQVSEVIDQLRIDHVFSPVPQGELPKIYRRLNDGRVRFHHALTGYLEDEEVRRIESFVSPDRPIDIGYRAWHAAPWLGRHGQLKTEIARVVGEAAAARGLRTDISTRDEDTLYGDDWSRFLASCKYTLGVEGGASILDHDGSVRARTEQYLLSHPAASFEEIEAACFPGRDGELALRAISPRHLECCAARTCQVLVEGEYDGVLEAGRHYIALKPDFSNLEDVLTAVQRDDRRDHITEAAHRDVVRSGRWTYARLVDEVQRGALGEQLAGAPPPPNRRDDRVHALARTLDRASWIAVAALMRVLMPLWLRLLALIPPPLKRVLKGILLRRMQARASQSTP